MGFCNQCGAPLTEGRPFCSGCGKPVEQNAQGQYTQGQYTQGQPYGGFQADNPLDHTAEFDPGDIAANKGMGILAYLWLLFLIPLLAAPNSRYARFHASQGLNLFLVSVVCSIISGIFNLIRVPYLAFGRISYYATPWFINGISSLLWLGWLVFVIIGIVNAAQGRAKELPLLGRFRIINYN